MKLENGFSNDEEMPAPLEMISPVPHSGNPGTYKILLAKAGPYSGELVIDLGFSNYLRFSEVMTDMTPFKAGEVIAFTEETGEVRKSREEELYTYRAWVRRVLDGDTVEAVVDLGFGFTTTQILRLRGIDAPEIQGRDGKEAKEFVETMLPVPGKGGPGAQSKEGLSLPGGAGEPVFIRTSKSDKYDRYLADVFLTDKNGEEQYLNNLLLEQGHAVRVGE
jgi:endonuclease YncB( thermonuclease family)